jgi:hypothetical protein
MVPCFIRYRRNCGRTSQVLALLRSFPMAMDGGEGVLLPSFAEQLYE